MKSSYLGAGGTDTARALAIHPASGEVYVAGDTNFGGFPGVSGGAQSVWGGGVDAFVSRFSADLTLLVKSSYLGATGNDVAFELAIHPATGEVYVAGYTDSTTNTFPGVVGGAQSVYGGGSYDGFVSRFSADLTTLIKSSYLGAAGDDRIAALAIHQVSGDVYVAGTTVSLTTTFPGVSGGAQSNHGGFDDAFVSRFSADLTANATTPGAFSFTTQTNVPVSTVRTSNPALVTGIVGAANIYSDGTLGSSYCVSSANNCSCDQSVGFVSTPGTITNNSYVCARHTAAAAQNVLTQTNVHVGGAVGRFFVSTGSQISAAACNLDMDGDTLLTATKEGLVLLRAMLGFTGAATTAGTGVTASQWANARPLINANCGTNFAP